MSVTGYMCETDFANYLEDGSSIYPSIEYLSKRKCVGTCCNGIEVVLIYKRRVINSKEEE
jgi:hypothetical protein